MLDPNEKFPRLELDALPKPQCRRCQGAAQRTLISCISNLGVETGHLATEVGEYQILKCRSAMQFGALVHFEFRPLPTPAAAGDLRVHRSSLSLGPRTERWKWALQRHGLPSGDKWVQQTCTLNPWLSQARERLSLSANSPSRPAWSGGTPSTRSKALLEITPPSALHIVKVTHTRKRLHHLYLILSYRVCFGLHHPAGLRSDTSLPGTPPSPNRQLPCRIWTYRNTTALLSDGHNTSVLRQTPSSHRRHSLPQLLQSIALPPPTTACDCIVCSSMQPCATPKTLPS